MLNLHLLECTVKGYDHISDLLLAKYWVITGCKYQYCSNLTNVTIGHSVSEIRYEAFDGCYNLTNVTIPGSVTKIGNNAFASCSNLINVYCKPETPPAAICWYGENWGAFETNASGRKIYVPRGYGNIYKAADGWIDYEADIIEYDF